MSDDSLDARFSARMGALLGPDFPTDIALAVSGGGDSMAMLALAHGWARVMGVRLWVVTVDHGLRAESADEARMVAEECARLGHPHATLRWHWDGRGNLQDAARRARLALIDRWRGGLDHVLFAHTQDDAAETFLMRLARGSGVEGLSAMAERRHVKPSLVAQTPIPAVDITQTEPPPPLHRHTLDGPAGLSGFQMLRPLLDVSRSDLRHYADTLHVPYVDDPSNEDPRFDRVRMRQAMAGLAELGLDRETLAGTARRMARARMALEARAAEVAEGLMRPVGVSGQLALDRDTLASVERDTQLRVLAGALQWVSGAEYRPRAAPLDTLLDRVLAGGGGTLSGAQILVERDIVRVVREFAAVRHLVVPAVAGARWDGLWDLSGPGLTGLTIRALGEDGWNQIADRVPDGARFAACLSLPALFDGERLVACPPLGVGAAKDLRAAFRPPVASFVAFLKRH